MYQTTTLTLTVVLLCSAFITVRSAGADAGTIGRVALAAPNATGAPAVDADRISLADRVWIASKIYSTIQSYFGHWQAVPDLDLDATYKQYLQQVVATDDRLAFNLATMEFIAHLRNGHSTFSDSWLGRTHGRPLGFFLSPMDGKWVVTWSRVADLAPGDVVQAIDGKSFDEFLAQKAHYIAASGAIARRQTLFYSPWLFPETFTLTLADGRTVRIQRGTQELKPSVPRPLEGRMLDDNIGYFRIPSFGNPKNEDQAVEFVKQHAQAKCLIFDVRGNGGGTTPRRLIRALMDRPYRDWMESSALSIGVFSAYRQIAKIVPPEQFSERQRGYFEAFSSYFDHPQFVAPGALTMPENPLYTGPVILLTDNDTASAAEDFVMPLKTSGRARVVGQTTYGSSGQPYLFDFGNGISFRVSSKRQFFPDGSPFEGVGIVPEIAVQPSLDDLRKGTDVVLIKALELAGAAVNPAPPNGK